MGQFGSKWFKVGKKCMMHDELTKFEQKSRISAQIFTRIANL